MSVQQGDERKSGEYLDSALTINHEAYALLRKKLSGIDISGLKVVDDQGGSMHGLTVRNAQGGLLGEFNVNEEPVSCYLVDWGDIKTQ